MNSDYNSISIVGISFFLSVIFGPIIIPILEKMKVGQSIRKEGPKSHMSKEGTPTMGGLIIMSSVLLSLIIFAKGNINKDVMLVLLSSLAFGLIGFIDDYIIVVKKDNRGLTEKQKLILQSLLAIILSSYYALNAELGTKLIIPFVKYRYLDLGFFYIPFMSFVIVGTVNSVNLTDGLDGLASGITMIVMSFFAIIAELWGMPELSNLGYIFTGACLGFLVHNYYPAKVFMGDTGSLALGGAVVSMAMVLKLPLIIPILGGIYLIEALSVIVQVVSYKLRGKRVFLMSPLHHHFEHKGWKETKVVKIFWLVSLILAMISFKALI